MSIRSLHRRFIEPKSRSEDTRRREFIFNVLLLGLMSLTFVAFFVALIRFVQPGANHHDSSPVLFLPPLLLLGSLYRISRRGFNNFIVYVFLALYLALGTYALFQYGFVLPTGLLTYVLVIIMTGILISASASVVMTVLVMSSLSILAYVQTNHITHPYIDELDDPLKPGDLIVFFFIFAVILLVTWLSSREIDKSLKRARKSERELRKERNMLEVKVRERTKELEKTQAERMLELHRFAEFGRLNSTLMHDLADPLTAARLSIEQASASKRYKSLLKQISQGVDQMEQYVVGARRQLQKQREVKDFDVVSEVQYIVSLHQAKAVEKKITIEQRLDKQLMLHGDSIQFNHIISNLLSNAIDAYDEKISRKRIIFIEAKQKRRSLEITIRDNGHGINPEHLKKIFDAFYTTKSGGRGTGIGLLITKQAVENEFGGTIAVKSSRVGTAFKVTLPLP